MAISFHEQEIKSRLTDRTRLKQYLAQLIHGHRSGLQRIRLDYIFCSDEYLHKINMDFLQHDTYTDIITFDLSEEENKLAGEIYISTERVQENADRFGVTYQQELLRVIFHGALHLCGFRDKKKSEQEEMRRQENAALEGYATVGTIR